MTTYGQLKTDVDEWLARDDVAVTGGSIATITRLAESEIAKHIRTVVQEQRTTLTATGRYTDLPSDYLAARNPFIDSQTRKFEYKPPETIREHSTWNNGNTLYYSIEGDEDTNGIGNVRLVLAPAASASSPVDVEILYWARFPALSADPDTNWLLQNYYDVYLYAMLWKAAELVQERDLKEEYKSEFYRVKADVAKTENRKRYRGNQWQAYGNPRTIV